MPGALETFPDVMGGAERGEAREQKTQVSTHVSKFGYKGEKRNVVVVGGSADQGIVFCLDVLC